MHLGLFNTKVGQYWTLVQYSHVKLSFKYRNLKIKKTSLYEQSHFETF